MELLRPEKTSRCTWDIKGAKSPHTDRSKLNNRMTILPSVLHAVGQTPLVRLNNIPKKHGIACEIVAKCEFLNPGGSVKDRIGYRMIQDAEEKGILKPGCTIIELTSGNTGIGLAMAAAVKGYRCIIVMPENNSNEKIYAIRALGAEVVRTPMEAGYHGPEGHIATCRKIAERIPNSVVLDQYSNPGNPLAHYDQTAAEIWQQCDGKVDYLIVGAGTGGTITGMGRKFRELCSGTKIIGVDTPRSIVARNPDKKATHKTVLEEVEGIGFDFIPTSMDLEVVDSWIETSDHDSFNTARSLIKEEGLLCGGSSGANVFAALQIAKNLPADKRVVVVLPDGIRNYMTKFVSDHWMEAREFLDPPEPLESNKWWWNLPVSRMKLAKPIGVSPRNTCEEVVDASRDGKSHAPVIEDGKIKGFVELNKLLSALIAGQVAKTDVVEKAMNKSFRKVSQETTLGRVSRILEMENYVALIDDRESLQGVATREDLYNFIVQEGDAEVYGA